jgi:intraflagellar transport protein 46
VVVKRLDRADGRQIEQWVENIKELHRSRPPASVNYTRPMPDVDALMAEWPAEVQVCACVCVMHCAHFGRTH